MKTFSVKLLFAFALIFTLLTFFNGNSLQIVQAQTPATCITKQITNDTNHWDSFPSMNGDRIAWTRNTKNGTSPQIYIYDIRTGVTQKLLTLENVTFAGPILHGNYLGIVQGTNENRELSLYELASGQLTPLTSPDKREGAMRINDKYVLWGTKHKEENQIFLYDLKSGTTKPVSPVGVNRLGFPAPTLSGDYAAWKLHDGEHDEFFVYHIPSGVTKQITDHSELFPDSNWSGEDPKLIGNYLWYFGFDYETYLYDITTQSYVDLPFDPSPHFTQQYVLGFDKVDSEGKLYHLSEQRIIDVPGVNGTSTYISGLSDRWLVMYSDYSLPSDPLHFDLAVFDLKTQTLERLTNNPGSESGVVVDDKYVVWTAANPNAEDSDDGFKLTDLFIYYCPEPPTIVTSPLSATISSGTSTTLTVNAQLEYGTDVYQWYQGESGDTSIPVGFDSSGFTTPVLTQNTSYWVRVSNEFGNVDSASALVRITPAPFTLPHDINNVIIRDPSTLTAFHWAASANVEGYTFALINISSNTRLGEILNVSVNPLDKCSTAECTVPVELSDLKDGLYSWTVVAHNPNGITEASNSPFFFSVDTGAVELLKNGGFETALNDWTSKNLSGDKVKCNQDGKEVAYSGNCAYHSKGSIGESSSLKQTVSSANILQGDQLTLTAYINPKRVSLGQKIVVAKVNYADTTTDKLELTVLTDEVEGYSLFTDVLTVDKPITGDIKVQVRYKGTSGSVIVDNVSLLVSQIAAPMSEQNTLPLPSISN